MKLDAFRKGVIDGLTSPLGAFYADVKLDATGYRVSVADAWADVGETMHQALRREEVSIGQATVTQRIDTYRKFHKRASNAA